MAKKAVPRVEEHLDKLRTAGLDTQAFFAALIDIRDDSALSTTQRDALYKMVAAESFLWYLDALNGAPIDRAQIEQEVKRLVADNYPREEVTVRERPPPPASSKPKGPTLKQGSTKFDRPPKK